MLGQGSIHQYVLQMMQCCSITGKLWSREDVDGREVTGGGIVRCVGIEVTGVMGTTGTTSVVFTGTSPIVDSAFNVDFGT